MKREKNPNQRAFKIVTKKQIVITKPTDEPIPEIDTEKAVAFAMSIAQEMKLRQREADEAHKSESTIVYKDDYTNVPSALQVPCAQKPLYRRYKFRFITEPWAFK